MSGQYIKYFDKNTGRPYWYNVDTNGSFVRAHLPPELNFLHRVELSVSRTGSEGVGCVC